MARIIGTSAYGIRLPIVKEGDDLINIIVRQILELGIKFKDRDIVGVTESLLARAQGNFADLDDIRKDFENKFSSDEVSLVHPILSRNRFLNILKALAATNKKVKIYLSYPADEVGNHLMDRYEIMKKGVNIYQDSLTEEDYKDLLGKKYLHPFTGLDYTELYKNEFEEGKVKIIYSNNLDHIAQNSKSVLVANIYDRDFIKDFFENKGLKEVYSLADIMNEPIGDSGYNEDYGLYGSNLSSGNQLKLFPRDCQAFVNSLQEALKKETGKNIEVLLYGDGAFKDPVGQIWELADPVVSPAYTQGLAGRPDEVKLKYLADNEFSDLDGEKATEAIKEKIKSKNQGQVTDSSKLGTTPRQVTDLVGTLCDLVSGSGDKGTPVVYISGYFDNYSAE